METGCRRAVPPEGACRAWSTASFVRYVCYAVHTVSMYVTYRVDYVYVFVCMYV